MKSVKKTLCLILVMLLLGSSITPVMASDNIKVRIGGALIKFDVKPQIINDRTMVPLRAIFEALGATVDWNGDTQTITATKEKTTIELKTNNSTMLVNGESVTLDSSACLIDGRTLVPVRAISEAFKLKVEWDDSVKTVRIRKPTSLISEGTFGAHVWKYTYDENGKEICKIDTKQGTFFGLSVTYKYDENENKILSYASDNSYTEYKYDDSGNLIFEINQYGDWISYAYDSNGNNIYLTDSRGAWSKFDYDEKNNLIKVEENGGFSYTYEYVYDFNENLIMKKSGEDIWTKYEYNEENNLISSIDNYGTNIKYVYDENGNLIYQHDNHGNYIKYIVMEI